MTIDTEMLTARDISVLECLANYFLMNRRQIQALCYPKDHDGRITRRRLSAMCRDKHVKKLTMQVVNPRDGSLAPVYQLATRGRTFVAEHLKEPRVMLKPLEVPQPQHLFHYLSVTDTHILLDYAIQACDNVRLDVWFNEDEIVNYDEPDRSKQFKLETLVTESPRRTLCRPDAAFQLEYQQHRGVFYLEQDRDSYWHGQVAKRKTPGYMKLAEVNGHRKHFPETTIDRFTVLCVTPSSKRRDALREAFRGMEGKERWRFANYADFVDEPASFLRGQVWHPCDEDAEPVSLLK